MKIKQFYMNLFDGNGECQLCRQGVESRIGKYWASRLQTTTYSKAIQPTHLAWHRSRGDLVDSQSGRVYREVEHTHEYDNSNTCHCGHVYQGS